MSVELEKRLHSAREVIGDVLRGHKKMDEERIRRIVLNPSSISEKDRERYKEGKLRSIAPTFPTASFSIPILAAMRTLSEEEKRLKALTPEELNNEVLEDALKKAEDWRLF